MVINLNRTKPLITKQAILSYINDLEIYRKYIDSSQEITVKKPMLSPLRKEETPSFGIFPGRNGELYFKDHLLGGGDCIKFVQMKFGLPYFEALSRIATDFDLAEDYICKKMEKIDFKNNQANFATREQVLSKVTPFTLGKNRREWALHDIMFWRSFGISIETLRKFRVEAISYIWINGRAHKADRYAYCFTELKDGVETYKIYQPYSINYKWINGHNDAVWQGWEQLPQRGEKLIITKSLKDVMAIHEVTGIPAVSLQSENVFPKEHVFDQLRSRFVKSYLLYDNDFNKETNWGKLFGEKIAEKYDIRDIYIPEAYRSKDFSDLVKNVGAKTAKEILETQMDVEVPF